MDAWISLSLLAGIIAAYYYFFKDLSLFKKHDILHLSPSPIVGNMGPIFTQRMAIANLVQKVYNLKQDAKYVGIFDGMNPILMVRDPELIKSIAVKNFDMFPDHRGFIDEANDPLIGKGLFSLRGDRWRDMRSLLTPAFTASKMKTMFRLMVECATNFTDFIHKLPTDKSTIEMKDCFTRYTNDVIAICVFGINVDSMRNRENEFYVYGKEIMTFNLMHTIRFYLVRSMPRLTKLLGIKFMKNHMAQFFGDIVRSEFWTRNSQNIVRPDILQLMIDSRDKLGLGKEMSMEDIISQAVIFFLAGLDTASVLMCFAAHEIAVNPEIHTRLRHEVDAVLKATNGELTYEALNEMQYLDAVVNETLRLWPTAVFLDRKCIQDFELPPSLPGNKPFIVKKGMVIWFPVHALQRDPKYFDNPNLFDPERFLNANKRVINSSVYLPFGVGPRRCIGDRFAILETKIVLFHLLARCDLKPCEKTSHPLQLSKKHFSMMAEGGFWLKIQPRSHKVDVFSSVTNDTAKTSIDEIRSCNQFDSTNRH